MHIPDGFLDLRTAAAAAVLSGTGLSLALHRLKVDLPRRKIPLMGLAAAFVFVAQMLNFPIAGGTSGHLLGAVLVAVLLGPSAAVVVMTAVLLVQCLLFADGGLLALGANIFNMGVAAVLGGHLVFWVVDRLLPSRRGFLLATTFAAWCSTVFASVSCATELALSGVAPWGLVFPAMTNIHMLIGLGEGLITAMVVVAIQRARPDLLPKAAEPVSPRPYRLFLAAGLVVITSLLVFALPFAASSPDGLERVAEMLGFAGREAPSPLLPAAMTDYRVPWVGSAAVATCLAGAAGAVIVFVLAYALAVVLVPRPANDL